MKLSEVKQALKGLQAITFRLPNGNLVPSHFHVTEVGKVSRTFIDCGGTMRSENVVNFQLWNATDYDHRLHPEKLVAIISLSESKLGITDADVRVEYQGDTIETYDLAFDGSNFLLEARQTDCLAKDNCGIPEEKVTLPIAEDSNSCCSPESGCC